MIMEKIIYKWIETLINNGDIPLEIIDDNFTIEDGMNLEQYWEYEKSNFNQYAENCRLKEGFNISIVNAQKLNANKNIVSFYVKNNLGKIIFKMNLTILNNSKISSNNYYSHIVPKFVIEKNKIIKLGLAIKSPKEIENIISSDLELISFDKSSSFNEDGFYTAQFEIEDEIQNKVFNFYIKMGEIKEKRTIFFDNFDLSLCPYILGDWTMITKDDAYPVNLAVYYINGLIKNVAYPIAELEGLYGVKKIIVTDSLDNDWIINVK
jgi:hypothetical protein